MTQNKIPTDEEILAGWNFYQTNQKIDRPSLLTLIREARAAGREEQRERVRLALEKSCECCQCAYENCFSYIQEAIRAQGEK